MTTPGTTLYPDFQGRIGRTREESQPWWPAPKTARPGSPNIVVIYMDDMGYSDLGCYGSEIATPNIDALARRGVRFNHYTTHPICSPARAALLTGRNAHAVATGWLANNNPGFPGYSGDIPLEAPTIAETLKAAGYATIGIGKWHNSTNGATPNETWPTQRGFERFYGFLEGETSYFFPARIMHNNMLAPIDEYPPDYYATDDWTDKAMSFVRTVRNDDAAQPFFLYLAYNAVHGPLQAKDCDLAKYRGRYDAGWDAVRAARLAKQKSMGLVPADAQLSPRDPSVPAWEDVPAEQRELFVRHMETYAAMLDCVDQNVGRLVAQIDAMGELENTIFVFSSDNGGTSSGGPAGAIHFNRRFAGLSPLPVDHDVGMREHIGTGRVSALYPMGWGQVSNTPFPSFKTYTGGGGRRVCMIVSWPKEIADRDAVRTQFTHVTDVMPTLLDLAGVPALTTSHGKPAMPIQGVSFAPSLRDARAPSARAEQYYECWANRAFYRDGWVAVSLQVRGGPIDFDRWTLHRHADDFSESVDLGAKHPDKLRELVEAFDATAWGNAVYPLDNRLPIQKFNQLPPHLRPPESGTRRFLPGSQTVHRWRVVPLVADRSFKIHTTFRYGPGDEGVLFALGEVMGGMVMYVEDGALKFFYNGFGEYRTLEPMAIAAGGGERRATIEYEALGGRRGRGRMVIDGTNAGAWQDLSPTLMYGFHEGLDIGIDRRAPVSWALREKHGAFRYSGEIVDVKVESGAFAPDSAFAKG
ncbi:MAG: arylsulfatase [Burkholderiaceae bacterium]